MQKKSGRFAPNQENMDAAPETPIGVSVKPAPHKHASFRRRVSISTGSDSFVEQSHKRDCDINHIIEKYSRDELKELLSRDEGIYGDFSKAVDYKSALDTVNRAREQFDALPSDVRREFDNNPAKFLAFATNEKNAERMVELGLAKKRPIIDPPASKGDIERLGDKISPKKAPAGDEK